MAGDFVNVLVEDVEGGARAAVYAERDGEGLTWAYAIGDGEAGSQEDSGTSADLEGAAEDIARSLASVGFDTDPRLVMAGFEQEGWA